VIIKKSYKNRMKNLRRSYAKLIINLRRHVSYKNVKFAASDVFLGNPLSEAVIGRML